MATPDYLQKSDGVTVPHLADSSIYDDGTNVIIGANNLNIPGDVRLYEYGSFNLAFLQARDGNSNRDIGLRLRTQKAGTSAPDITEAVTINKEGYTGVGTEATDPKGLLQLNKSYIVAAAPIGTVSTDEANIRNAIDAVTQNGKGGTVYLQAGTYAVEHTNFNYPTALPEGLSIIGAGMETTIIKMGDVSGTTVIKIDANGVTVKDLSIESVPDDHRHIGIRLTGISGTIKGRDIVENVHIVEMDIGILCTGTSAADSGTYDNTFKHIIIYSCKTGVQIGEANSAYNNSNANRFYGGLIVSCHNYGVNFVNGCGNLLSGVSIEGNGTANNNNCPSNQMMTS